MITLKTRSDVKLKVALKCYMTLRHPKHASAHHVWDFSSNYIRDMLGQHNSKNLVTYQVHVHSDLKMVHATSPSQDAFTHQTWNSYLKENRRYAPKFMIILETSQRSRSHCPKEDIHHSIITRCIYTTKLRFLSHMLQTGLF